MYLGQVIFSELSATESITAAIEFVPIADVYGVSGMEVQMAKHIKALVLAGSVPFDRGTASMDRGILLRTHRDIQINGQSFEGPMPPSIFANLAYGPSCGRNPYRPRMYFSEHPISSWVVGSRLVM